MNNAFGTKCKITTFNNDEIMTMPKGWKPSSSTYSEEPSYGTPSPNSQIIDQIFIFYANEDLPAAIRLYDDLKNAGLNPWIDSKKILPGQEWGREIQNAVKNSRFIISIWSSNYVTEIKRSANGMPYQQQQFKIVSEVLHAAEKDDWRVPIIVTLDNSPIPPDFVSLQLLDLFPYEKNWIEGVKMLVQAIKNMLMQTTRRYSEAIAKGTMPKGWMPQTFISDNSSRIITEESFYSQDFLVFISYARENESAAVRLYNDLKNAGLNPWIDRKKILPGQEWETEIRNVIGKFEYFIPLFSLSSVKKNGYVQKEFSIIRSSIINQLLEKGVISDIESFLFPVRLDDCEVPFEELRDIRTIDLFPYERNWKEGVEMIARHITKDIAGKKDTLKHLDMADELFYMQDKHDEAIEQLDQALERAPDMVYKYLTLLAKAIFMNTLKRYVEAIECADMALKFWGTSTVSGRMWLEKGKALYGLRRYYEAIECYNKSLELQSDVGETWHKKGLALNAISDSFTANQCFDKARQLGYFEE
jgi:tetratricopeptide (TPR) repeat protein